MIDFAVTADDAVVVIEINPFVCVKRGEETGETKPEGEETGGRGNEGEEEGDQGRRVGGERREEGE